MPRNCEPESDTRTVHSFRYRRAHRLSGRPAYSSVFREGRRYHAQGFMVMARANGLPYMRLGLSVGRKMGKANKRNRIKRIIREGFRQAPHRQRGGLDLVVIPRRPDDMGDLNVVLDRLNRIMKAARRHLTNRIS